MTHPLGPPCRRCRTTEAGCARNPAHCCEACTHKFGEGTQSATCRYRRATIARVSRGPAAYLAVCLDCGHVTSQQRLISVALNELALLHGRQSWTVATRRAA